MDTLLMLSSYLRNLILLFTILTILMLHRYLEFNLLYDRGVRVGLESGEQHTLLLLSLLCQTVLPHELHCCRPWFFHHASNCMVIRGVGLHAGHH